MATQLRSTQQQTWILGGGDLTIAHVENGVCVSSLVRTRGQGVLVQTRGGGETPDLCQGMTTDELRAAGFEYSGNATIYRDVAGNEYNRTDDGTYEGDPELPAYRADEVEVI